MSDTEEWARALIALLRDDGPVAARHAGADPLEEQRAATRGCLLAAVGALAGATLLPWIGRALGAW